MIINNAVIKISNLRLRTFIGFNPEELEKKQDVVINAEVHYPCEPAFESDDKNQAVNYKNITKAIINLVENGQFKLLEKLAGEILVIAMEHPDVSYAAITVDKPHALRFADSVSLTLSAQRS